MAGDINWIREHYEFDSIAYGIDELVILNVGRNTDDTQEFSQAVAEISKRCFIPISAGGRIRTMADAHLLLESGADKLVVNTPLFSQPELVHHLVNDFGSQCVTASIDYKRNTDHGEVFTENGTRSTGHHLPEAIAMAQSLGVGELYLTSMTRDGTGQGTDHRYISQIGHAVDLPIIIAGGAGTFAHLSDALLCESITAVATANLFNFMGDNLTEARQHIIDAGTPLGVWESSLENLRGE